MVIVWLRFGSIVHQLSREPLVILLFQGFLDGLKLLFQVVRRYVVENE